MLISPRIRDPWLTGGELSHKAIHIQRRIKVKYGTTHLVLVHRGTCGTAPRNHDTGPDNFTAARVTALLFLLTSPRANQDISSRRLYHLKCGRGQELRKMYRSLSVPRNRAASNFTWFLGEGHENDDLVLQAGKRNGSLQRHNDILG